MTSTMYSDSVLLFNDNTIIYKKDTLATSNIKNECIFLAKKIQKGAKRYS